VVSACSGGHLTNYFFKSQIPRGLPGGGGLIAVGFDSYIREVKIPRFRCTCTGSMILVSNIFVDACLYLYS
jgi:hypothetical protein